MLGLCVAGAGYASAVADAAAKGRHRRDEERVECVPVQDREFLGPGSCGVIRPICMDVSSLNVLPLPRMASYTHVAVCPLVHTVNFHNLLLQASGRHTGITQLGAFKCPPHLHMHTHVLNLHVRITKAALGIIGCSIYACGVRAPVASIAVLKHYTIGGLQASAHRPPPPSRIAPSCPPPHLLIFPHARTLPLMVCPYAHPPSRRQKTWRWVISLCLTYPPAPSQDC
ncbi:hypothetical protein BD779DRAFT_1470030 [Infundibulicybe gibba]|nr:hypothetical protein BD779DRAFT_1470030 [Infundibulicybe gibba]